MQEAGFLTRRLPVCALLVSGGVGVWDCAMGRAPAAPLAACPRKASPSPLGYTFLTDAAGLDPYYVSTRYPDAIGGALPADSFYGAESEKAIERAARVLQAVRERLPRPDGGTPRV
jgi:hypothetical protein